jgi:hypothetical protein
MATKRGETGRFGLATSNIVAVNPSKLVMTSRRRDFGEPFGS